MNTLSGTGCTIDHDMLVGALQIAMSQGCEAIRVAMIEANPIDGKLIHIRWERIEHMVQHISDVASLLHVLKHMDTDKRQEGFRWENLPLTEGDENDDE
jgi:hypothetical protein